MRFQKQFILMALLFLCVQDGFAGGSLSWEDCIKSAIKQNPALESARQTLRSSEYKVKGAKSGFLPQVNGSLGYSYGDSESGITTSGSSGTLTATGGASSYYTASITANENVFAGLSDKAKIESAKAGREYSSVALRAAKAKASYDLKQAFANLRYAQEYIELARKIIQRREDNYNMISLRYETGRENKGSLLLSAAYIEQAKLEELQARDGVRVAQEQLAKVLGLPDPRSISLKGEVPLGGAPDPYLKPEDLAVSSTTYQSAVAQRKTADAAITTARSAFFPSLNLSATAGKQGKQWFPKGSMWQVGANLSVPFFNGGYDYYATKSAIANYSASVANVDEAFKSSSTTLETTLSGFIEAVQKLKADTAFASASEVREEISRTRYENGLLAFDDFDIIENEYINKQKQYLQSKKDRIIAEAAWEQAQGKGVFE